MINKILIANRGEIVGRISRTAHRMGIKTVSIYSEIDEDAIHPTFTDESVKLEGKLSKETYLDFQKILEACRSSGADAVHPGFGFVSENSEFVNFIQSHGIKFIGPNASSMKCMGDKIESKILAKKAGVNVIPGLIEPIEDVELGIKVANEIGYPVLLKAAAGGGGRGIRVVWHDKDLKDNFELVVNEARNSFGNGSVFIEKYIENPRHIEIQILGDKHGNCVFLYERECSIQRRYQKIIEEAPSPFFENLGPKGMKIREEMGRQSVLLAKAIGYYSAGTVEFVVDKDGNFYFLEVNTRLQVEHPVTEEVVRVKRRDGDYRLDLVEWMIRIENGETLPFTQSDLYLEGHAIETRIYAENPESGFMPSSGRICDYSIPNNLPGLRVESGVRKGSDVSVYYDPMIAKICFWGKDRKTATLGIKHALAQTVIHGDAIKTNMNFLYQILDLPEFEAGNFSTSFIKQKYGENISCILSPEDKNLFRNFLIANILISLNNTSFLARTGTNLASPGESMRFAILSQADNYYKVHSLSLIIMQNNTILIEEIDGINVLQSFKILKLEENLLVFAQVDNRGHEKNIHYFKFFSDDNSLNLESRGFYLRFRTYPEHYGELHEKIRDAMASNSSLDDFVLSPLPGLVASLNVHEGQTVDINTNLMIIEAMKMQNVIYSKRSGKIKKIFVKEKEIVAADQKLLEFE
jgi:propionyl-CoA carboxylase alpha chain